MQPLNFVRQIKKQVLASGDQWPLVMSPQMPDLLRNMASKPLNQILYSAVNFCLPKGGRVLADPELKAIADMDIRLPFAEITLEYAKEDDSKTVLVCSEVESFGVDGEVLLDQFVVFVLEFDRAENLWVCSDFSVHSMNGELRAEAIEYQRKHKKLSPAVGRYQSEEVFNVVFGFLNALACSNVRAERLPARKPKKKAKKQLPFDDYHILTIGHLGNNVTHRGAQGERRETRMHLRRGHIRRLHDERKIWVNATVVKAASKNKVQKEYRVPVNSPPTN